MECNYLPAPRMSGESIASCVGSVAQVFMALVVVGGFIYTASKIGIDRVNIKRKDTELEVVMRTNVQTL